MRQAFTLIELIFTIVMIGILASIAIPKLASSRIDASASMCSREITQLTRELSNFYTRIGHGAFKDKLVSEMTNIRILSNSDAITGIISDKSISTGIEYKCDGTKIANFIYTYDPNILRYGLILQITDGTTPASLLSSNTLKDNLNIPINGRYYVF